jgi:5-methylcytosine-specific restriction endonuclease McrA
VRWKLLRLEVLLEDVLCARCHMAASRVVDHVIPARVYAKDDIEKFWDRSNLQGLCDSAPSYCHHTKTGEDMQRYSLESTAAPA